MKQSQHILLRKETLEEAKEIVDPLLGQAEHLTIDLRTNNKGLGIAEHIIHKVPQNTYLTLDLSVNFVKSTQANKATSLVLSKMPLTIDLRNNVNIDSEAAQNIMRDFLMLRAPLNIYLSTYATHPRYLSKKALKEMPAVLCYVKVPLQIILDYNENSQPLLGIDNIAIDSANNPMKFNSIVGKHATFNTFPVLIDLNNINWLLDDILTILTQYIGCEEIARINMAVIYPNDIDSVQSILHFYTPLGAYESVTVLSYLNPAEINQEVIVDNKLYTLRYDKLGLTWHNYGAQSFTNTLSSWMTMIDQYFMELMTNLVNVDKKYQMEQIATQYGYTIDTSEQDTKGTYLKLARKMHPDKGGNKDAFIAIDDVYKKNPSLAVVEITQNHLNVLHKINIALQSINTIMSGVKTICTPTEYNIVTFSKDLMLTAGLFMHCPTLIAFSFLADVSYKIYKEEYQEAMIASMIDILAAAAFQYIVLPPFSNLMVTTGFMLYTTYNALYENPNSVYSECINQDIHNVDMNTPDHLPM